MDRLSYRYIYKPWSLDLKVPQVVSKCMRGQVAIINMKTSLPRNLICTLLRPKGNTLSNFVLIGTNILPKEKLLGHTS